MYIYVYIICVYVYIYNNINCNKIVYKEKEGNEPGWEKKAGG